MLRCISVNASSFRASDFLEDVRRYFEASYPIQDVLRNDTASLAGRLSAYILIRTNQLSDHLSDAFSSGNEVDYSENIYELCAAIAGDIMMLTEIIEVDREANPSHIVFPQRSLPEKIWYVSLPGVILPTLNEQIRMNRRGGEYAKFRNHLYTLAKRNLQPSLPPEPLRHCKITVEMTRTTVRLLDVDSKYGAVKPLLDILQPNRPFKRKIGKLLVDDDTLGLGLIKNDSDGESTNKGCIRQLRVIQKVGEPRIDIAVAECSELGLFR